MLTYNTSLYFLLAVAGNTYNTASYGHSIYNREMSETVVVDISESEQNAFINSLVEQSSTMSTTNQHHLK